MGLVKPANYDCTIAVVIIFAYEITDANSWIKDQGSGIGDEETFSLCLKLKAIFLKSEYPLLDESPSSSPAKGSLPSDYL